MSRTAFTAIVSGLLSACASTAKLPIIDVHTHTHFTGAPERTSNIPDTREQYLRELREAGAVGAVAHANAELSDWVDLRAQDVIHCAGVGESIDAGALDAALAAGRFRCLKIYLGYVHRFAYDAAYTPVYELARKHKVPVVFHTGDTYSAKGKLKYAHPLTIDEVAVDWPDVKFVIAHCGNPWIESAAEVAYKNPNVFLDGSAFLIGDVTSHPERVEEYMVKPLRWIFGFVEDPSKLMFGSDWPLVSIKDYAQAFKRAIPREHWRKVFYENARAVFGFPDIAQARPR